MKIVVIGGTGLIGSKLVMKLRQQGHEVLAASPDSGVNTLTGEGLAAALAGAQVVVDLTNSPSFEDAAVLKFFETSGRNLLAAEAAAGVKHHVALSIVGADRLKDSGYMRAKMVQEGLIKTSGIPYTILRSTQFFEFMDAVLSETSDDTTVRLPATRLQPIAAADVAAAVVEVSTGAPLQGIRNVAGPDVFPLDELGRVTLAAQQDKRTVITDDQAGMFAGVTGDVLTPGPDAHLAPTHYQDWIQTAG